MADLPNVVGFNIYQKFIHARSFCNMFTARRTAAPVPRRALAMARLRSWRDGQAIVRTDEATRDRSRRRVPRRPCPANPRVIARSAATGRAAPRGGNGG